MKPLEEIAPTVVKRLKSVKRLVSKRAKKKK
jgi:hypothetical protein